MALSRVGTAIGFTSANLPTHQAGDLIIAFAYRDGSTAAPGIPTSPAWVPIDNPTGANTTSAVTAYFVATSSSTTTGTWSNATAVIFVVYRGALTASPIGGHAVTGGSSTTVTYPALTMALSDASSWVIGLAGHRSIDTSIATPPAGMINVADRLDSVAEAVAHDTNGGISAWAATSVSVGGTSSGWRAHTVEIKARRDVVLTAGHGTYNADFRDADLYGIVRGSGNPAPLPSLATLLPNPKTLTAASGTYSVSGQAAAFKAVRKMPAAQGSLSISGQSAAFRRGRYLGAAQGTLSVGGQSAGLIRIAKLGAAQGSYAVGGQAAQLNYGSVGSTQFPAPLPMLSSLLGSNGTSTLTAGSGTYSISGQPIAMRKAPLVLTAAQGNYSVSGQAAGLTVNLIAKAWNAAPLPHIGMLLQGQRVLTADYGQYTVAGQVAVRIITRGIAAGSGVYSILGSDALRDFQVTASGTTYTITGQAAILTRRRIMSAAQGFYNLAGQPTALRATHAALPAASGTYQVFGQVAGVSVGHKIPAASGTYGFIGQAATLLRVRRLLAAQGTYATTGNAANLVTNTQTNFTLTAQSGAYSVTGLNAGMRSARNVAADGSSYALTGYAASVHRVFTLTALPGSYSTAGFDVGGGRVKVLAADYGAFSVTGYDAVLSVVRQQLGANTGTFDIVGFPAILKIGSSVDVSEARIVYVPPERRVVAVEPGVVNG